MVSVVAKNQRVVSIKYLRALNSFDWFSLFWCVEACFDVAKHGCHKENK